MNNDRAVVFLCEAQCALKLNQIMAIYRAKIIQTHGAENITGKNFILYYFLKLMAHRVELGKLAEHGLKAMLQGNICRANAHLLQKAGSSANIGVNGHVIIIDNNYHRFAACSCTCKAFIGEAAGKGTVTNKSDNIILISGKSSCLCHAQGNGN